jgi:hypothetical protein
MLFGCAVVASFNLNGLSGLNFLAPLGLNGLNGLHGLFFSPAFLAEVFCAPHDQVSMCPYAFQAREGLHRIIVPEVLFGMVSIVGTDPTEFQRLICKVEPVEATSGLW